MNIKNRQKTAKLLAAALLAADFNRREMEEVAEAMAYDETFRSETAQLFRDVAKLFSQSRVASASSKTKANTQEGEFLRLIRRIGISQRHLLDLLSKNFPAISASFEKKRLTTVELIEHLFREYPGEMVRLSKDLQDRFSDGPMRDPYLELIGKRLDR